MTELKFPQTHIPPTQLREKLEVARMYVALTREMLDMAFPASERTDLEALLVLVCVFIGDAEGRSTTATKLASHSGLSRPAVYRRLARLKKLKKVVRVGDTYHLAPGAVVSDEKGRIAKILRKFLNK
jgi:hypothetical protein